MRENFKAALSLSEDALEHIEELPCTISIVDLPGNDRKVFFVCINRDRLYFSADLTLNVYSVSDLTFPIATFDLST